MNSRTLTLDSRQRELAQDAAGWRLISMLFECPAPGWGENLTALASEVADPGLRGAVEAALAEASEGLYHSIFGPGGPASAREVSYHDLLQFGGLMSELASYYEAFGYQPPAREPADHVSIEAGFVGYLRLKEAYALASGDTEHVEVTAEAATHFIEDHLSFVAERLAGTLRESGIPYLAMMGEALLQRVGPRRGATGT